MSEWSDKIKNHPLLLNGVLGALVLSVLHYHSKEGDNTPTVAAKDLSAMVDNIENNQGEITLKFSKADIAKFRAQLLRNPEVSVGEIEKLIPGTLDPRR